MFEKFLKLVNHFIEFSLAFTIGWGLIRHKWPLAIISICILLIIYATRYFLKRQKLKIPIHIEIIAIVFIYASFYLGDGNEFYEKIFWWDMMLHFISGVIFGIIGFGILYILYQNKKLKAGPFFMAFFSFVFAVAWGAIWEIIEYLLDVMIFFETKYMQTNLENTMRDLILDSAGAALAATWGYFHIKIKNTVLFDKFIGRLIEDNPEISPNLFKKIKRRKKGTLQK